MFLDAMNTKLLALGIEDWFIEIHHSSSDKFKSSPLNLDVFVTSCKGKELQGQNVRTIQRGLEFARHVQSGTQPFNAIKLAWQSYPLMEKEVFI